MHKLYKIFLLFCLIPLSVNADGDIVNEIIAQFENEINQILSQNDFNNIVTNVSPTSTETNPTNSEAPSSQSEQNIEQPQTTIPELTQEQKLQKVSELRENYENMKEIETSFENRTLGATGMVTMGIGGMQLASAISQDTADDNAERTMKAYLETFTCNYAAGKNIKGGEANIQLPGGNELIGLYSEYVGLANDLKTRKNALGLRSGIESEPILDSATSGLYDDISVGKTSGAFTSLARALSDPNGADAAAWAAQRAETAEQKKNALITVGAGAVATVAGNLLINRNNEKERSAEIIQKYENLKLGLDNIATEINNTASQALTTTTNECAANAYFSNNDQECITCKNNQIVKADKSGCECSNSGETIDSNGNCISTCQLTGILSSDGKCSCGNNAINQENKCVCNDKSIEQDDQCISISSNFYTVISEFSADNAFELGKHTLTQSANDAISAKKTIIEKALQSYNDKTYCLYITGHTDRTGWKKCYSNERNGCNDQENKKFSEQRAKTVLETLGLDNNQNVKAVGAGSSECDESTYENANEPKCRKIKFEIKEKKCDSNQ